MAEQNFERLHQGLRKPARSGAFTIQLTPEQQEQLAELIGKSGESIARLEVELLEGKIAPAAVLVGVAG
jgi:hypothetical protein